MMKKLFFFGFFALTIFFCPNSVGQEESTVVMTEEDFLQLVMQHHPMAYQANLRVEAGEAGMLGARGGFDPVLSSGLDNKRFKEQPYWLVSQTGLKVPVWTAIDVYLGYDYTSGNFLNNEFTLPSSGQAVAGLGIDLGKGLLFDDRRYAWKMAQLGLDVTETERNQMMLQLKRDARITYWLWAAAWHVYQINANAVEITEQRFEAVKRSFYNGSIPAIDTTEAELQVYFRRAEMQKAYKNLIKARYDLSNFLWMDGETPVTLDSMVRPVEFPEEISVPSSIDSIGLYTRQIISIHPELQAFDFKLQGLDLERKLVRESLRPELNLKYQVLGDAFNFGSGDAPFVADYKLGVQFKFPLLIREARGKLQSVKIKQLETGFDFSQKELSLMNKLNSLAEVLRTNIEQYQSNRSIINNSRILLEGEQRRFFLGSSSIFLINSREQKLIEAETKVIELEMTHFILNAEIDYLMSR